MLIAAHRNWMVLSNLRPRTVSERVKTMEQFERSLVHHQLAQATRLEIEAFLARDLAAESRRAYRSHLRAFYRWAQHEDFVTTDPTSRVPAIKVPRGTPRPIDADALVRAVDQADLRTRCWLLLMALAGLRCMEVSALRPQDLLVTSSGTLLFLREVKGGGSGTVPAHAEILSALTLLPVVNGVWWECSPHRVSTVVSRYLRGLGIDATAHQLRHFGATSWYRASGHDIIATATLMRHANLQTTMRYAQLDPTRPAEVVRSVPHLRAV